MNILTWIKRRFCKHDNIGEGWFIQQVRCRQCEDCGEVEIEGAGIKPFTKIINKTYTNYRHQ